MIAYRVSSYDTPCPPSPSRREGRWGKAGGEVVPYWCEIPYTAWAEVYRYDGIRRAEVADVSERLWIGRFDHLGFLDLGNETALADLRVAAEDLTGDDWRTCQDAAERLVAAGHRNLRVPSAALPGTFNLVLFGQRLPVPLDAEVHDPAADVPCCVAADRSIGVADVLGAVRHRGDPPRDQFVQALPTPLP